MDYLRRFFLVGERRFSFCFSDISCKSFKPDVTALKAVAETPIKAIISFTSTISPPFYILIITYLFNKVNRL